MTVVTGASRGIGRILALHLAARGHAVVAVARPSSDLESVAAAAAAGIVAMPTDITDPAAVNDLFGAIAAQLGTPRTVIAAAGSIDALGPVLDADPDRWWRAVTVDLRGTMLTAQAALRCMVPQRRGRLVTVYGNLGDRGTPHVSAFAAAKAGVARLTETLANEVSDAGITVLGLHPGFVRTPMTEHLAWSEDGQRWLPSFGSHAEKNWGNGAAAKILMDEIIAGRADDLVGRVLFAGDDLRTLGERVRSDGAARRLRLQP